MRYSYDAEIKKLQSTYLWCQNVDIEGLRGFIGRASDGPLVVAGSGGSLTGAALAALLHESTGKPASFTTPLQLRYKTCVLRDSSVLLVTAGGGNPDILECARFVASHEAARVAAVCMKQDSPLGKLAQRWPSFRVFEFGLPTGRDGFLATNSLMGMLALLTRGYREAVGVWREAQGLVSIATNLEAPSELLDRQTLVVLHAGWGTPAAMDLESKLVEASLANVQLADFRHFAHGRHNWLAKRPSETAVVAITTPEIELLASRTMSMLPKNLPCLVLRSRAQGPEAAIELVGQVMQLVACFGHARGLDPGKPGVPVFGRKIYHLSTRTLLSSKPSSDAEVAIARKLGAVARTSSLAGRSSWRQYYARFVQRLAKGLFGSIVLDYDGTLCDEHRRFSSLDDAVGAQLVRLAKAGLVIGIATGRGRSARVALREAIPKGLWKQVVVGYYHAAQMADLTVDDVPVVEAPSENLQLVLAALQEQEVLRAGTAIEARRTQISLIPRPSLRQLSWQCLQDVLTALAIPNITVTTSDHSFDILDAGVSKRALVAACSCAASARGNPGECLCIGDMGGWPGNDCQLLSEPFSLSVDGVSAVAETCWNLLPEGCRGSSGLIHYLSCLRARNGKAHFIARGGTGCRTT